MAEDGGRWLKTAWRGAVRVEVDGVGGGGGGGSHHGALAALVALVVWQFWNCLHSFRR